MREIYCITGRTGYWEDSYEYKLKAYADESNAKAFVMQLEKERDTFNVELEKIENQFNEMPKFDYEGWNKILSELQLKYLTLDFNKWSELEATPSYSIESLMLDED